MIISHYMNISSSQPLSRRESQIMEILHRRQTASAQEVMDQLADPPSYSAVRALLATMLEKGLVVAEKDSRKYVYRPAIEQTKAKRTAIKSLLKTFFNGKPEELVASLLDPKDSKLSKDEIDRIRKLIN